MLSRNRKEKGTGLCRAVQRDVEAIYSALNRNEKETISQHFEDSGAFTEPLFWPEERCQTDVETEENALPGSIDARAFLPQRSCVSMGTNSKTKLVFDF